MVGTIAGALRLPLEREVRIGLGLDEQLDLVRMGRSVVLHFHLDRERAAVAGRQKKRNNDGDEGSWLHPRQHISLPCRSILGGGASGSLIAMEVSFCGGGLDLR